MTTAFVTGASGFIGSHLTKRLLADGIRVAALVRDAAKGRRLEGMGARLVVGDVTDPASYREALGEADVLYHLAGLSRWWTRRRKDYYTVNVTATRRIMEIALDCGIPRVVHMSSLATIRQPGGVLTTESMERRDDFESHYARSKYEGEMEVLRLHAERGLQAVVVNPGVVIGPCDLKTFGRLIIDYANGRLEAVPFPDTIVPLVYIDDVVESLLAASVRGRPGERYIVVGDNITIRDVMRMLEELTGVPPPPRDASPLLLKAAALIGEAVAALGGPRPRLPLDAVRAMEIGAAGSSEKATTELGIAFTPLREALRRTLKWYYARGYIERPSDGPAT